MAKGSLGGAVFAHSEMAGHMLSQKDFYGPSDGANPGVVGLDGCESQRAHLKTKKAIFEHPVGPGEGDLENTYWLLGAGNPADGLTGARSDMVPL